MSPSPPRVLTRRATPGRFTALLLVGLLAPTLLLTACGEGGEDANGSAPGALWEAGSAVAAGEAERAEVAAFGPPAPGAATGIAAPADEGAGAGPEAPPPPAVVPDASSEGVPPDAAELRSPPRPSPDTAWFAGGCFWCMEPPFDAVDGVLSTTSGFMGGWMERPSYDDVTAGGTGHAEVVQVVFDPERVSYARLLDIFWVNVDPLDAGGQFCDRGDLYRSEIFVRDAEQGELAARSLEALDRSGRFSSPIVTRVTEAAPFWAAEEYHQGYYLKNPIRYRLYRTACGRDRRLRELWGDRVP
jgi:peptide-methionine (S)-S-oxide reductase